jgi:hypothetical protein
MANEATPEMVKFMEEQLGGKEAVYREFIDARLKESIKTCKLVGELLDVAEKEGWIDSLRATNIQTVFRATPSKSSVSSRTPRLTKEAKAELQGSILKFLKGKAPRGKSDIVNAVGYPASQVAPQLRALRDDGSIKTDGLKSKMVYSVPKKRSSDKTTL